MCDKMVFMFISILLISLNSFAQINFKADDINFRSTSNYYEQTEHHGDLKLLSDKTYYSGDTENWGWLYCNRVLTYGSSQTNHFDGNLEVSGNKNFIHPHPTDTTKEITYTCVESGEALTLVRGVASTENGKVFINLPEHFSLVTSSQELISVIMTPENKPVLLYVVSKSKEQIEVAMKKADFYEYGDVPFSFQVTGVRDGFENQKPIKGIFEERTVSPKRKAYNKKCNVISEKKLEKMLKKKEKMKKEIKNKKVNGNSGINY